MALLRRPLTTAELDLAREVERIATDVFDERKRQDRKFTGEVGKPQAHNIYKWNAILGEERGEVERAILEHDFGNGSIGDIRKELVETAAVAFAIIARIDDWDLSLGLDSADVPVYARPYNPKGDDTNA